VTPDNRPRRTAVGADQHGSGSTYGSKRICCSVYGRLDRPAQQVLGHGIGSLGSWKCLISQFELSAKPIGYFSEPLVAFSIETRSIAN
jgi:hypothetical protein